MTPRNAELVRNDSYIYDRKNFGDSIQAKLSCNNITKSRLTCCCKYDSYIICAGFSGELFFVEKNNLCVEYQIKVSDSIIRCVKSVDSEKILLIATDAGEIIVYDLVKRIRLYGEYSSSSVYNIVLEDFRSFITCEKNGDIFEWQYIPNGGIFRNKKILNAGSPVFAMDIIGNKLIVANSLGEKYEYNLQKAKLKQESICKANVFCLKVGAEDTIYYGLSTGIILAEEEECNLKELDSHRDAVRDIAFSTKKKWMFSVSKDRTVRAWNNGIPIVLTCVKDYLYQIIFSDASIYYIDGHGDIGSIHFTSDIDLSDNIHIINR